MNGNGIPTVGAKPIIIDIFSIKCIKSMHEIYIKSKHEKYA